MKIFDGFQSKRELKNEILTHCRDARAKNLEIFHTLRVTGANYLVGKVSFWEESIKSLV